MLGWIAIGLVVLAVAVLGGALAAVVGRLRPLARAQRRLAMQAEQAQRLRAGFEALSERLAALAAKAERVDRRARRLRQRRQVRRQRTRS